MFASESVSACFFLLRNFFCLSLKSSRLILALCFISIELIIDSGSSGEIVYLSSSESKAPDYDKSS